MCLTENIIVKSSPTTWYKNIKSGLAVGVGISEFPTNPFHPHNSERNKGSFISFLLTRNILQ